MPTSTNPAHRIVPALYRASVRNIRPSRKRANPTPRKAKARKKTAHLLSRWAVVSPSGLMGGTATEASGLTICLDLTLLRTVGGRGRTRAVLGHELVDLFLVLGVSQPIEEI